MNLDVDSPDKVSQILRKAVEAYLSSASELESSWQDKNAGKPWRIIARILDRAATKIDEQL